MIISLLLLTAVLGVSPWVATLTSAATPTILISEVMSCPATGDKEWVELVRLGAVDGRELEDELSLAGFALSDDKAVIWTGPAEGVSGSISFPAGETLVVIEFSKHYLNNTGDTLTLTNPGGDPLDFVVIPACAGAGLSFTHHPDGWQAGEPTRGSLNRLSTDPITPSPTPSPQPSASPKPTTNPRQSPSPTTNPISAPSSNSPPGGDSNPSGPTTGAGPTTTGPTTTNHPNLDLYLNPSYLSRLSPGTTLHPAPWAVLGPLRASQTGSAAAEPTLTTKPPALADRGHDHQLPPVSSPSLSHHLFAILGGGLCLSASLFYVSTLIKSPSYVSRPPPT